MSSIEYAARGKVEIPREIDRDLIPRWLEGVAARHGHILGWLTYIFTDDPTILEVNKQFLNHDYFTDIITFDDTLGRMVNGDIFISLDTVASNARDRNEPYVRELHRVIVHGLLHLCGINDKGPGERQVMEAHEDAALKLYETLKEE